MKHLTISFLALSLLVCIFSCGSDDLPDMGNNNDPNTNVDSESLAENERREINYDMGPQITTTISGNVVDRWNNLIENVKIQIGNSIIMTDSLGQFIFNDVPCTDKRTVIRYSKLGFFEGVATLDPEPNTFHNVFLSLEEAPTNTIDNINNFLFHDGGSISFPDDAFVNQNGEIQTSVEVQFRTISTTNPNLGRLMPGSDLTGYDLDENEVFLYSYGMIQCVLPEGIEMAEGKAAKISIYNNDSSPNPPQEIPLWYLDEETGLWVEQGKAILDNGRYEGYVGHFTYWNVDGPEDEPASVCVTVECNGLPVSNLAMGTSQLNGKTNAEGRAEFQVRPGQETSLWGFTNQFGSIEGTVIDIPALSPGEKYDVGVAELDGYGTLYGKVIGCDGFPKRTTLIMATSNSSESVLNHSDNLTGEFEMAIPANEAVTIYIPMLDAHWGPFTVSNCERKNMGIIDECHNRIPDGWSVQFSTTEIPELDNFIMERLTTTEARVAPCIGDKIHFQLAESASSQYSSGLQFHMSYETGTITEEKTSIWPCDIEGVKIWMLNDSNIPVENNIMEELGLFSLNFNSISGTLSYENNSDKWIRANFDVDFKLLAPGSSLDGMIVNGVGTFNFLQGR